MTKNGSDFFVVGGTLRHDTPSYVPRPADEELRGLATSGSRLCYVLTTRQMGKSSLMIRAARYLQQQGVHTAIIDLTTIGLAPIEEWYLSLLDDLQSQLDLKNDAEAWWEEHASLSCVKRFTRFVGDVIPSELTGPVVIFLDEIDSALRLDFSDDFFAAVRAICNQEAAHQDSEGLSFVLLGWATPNDLIKDQIRTPFNIGSRVRLEELALEDAMKVLPRGLPGHSEAILERTFYWTNGHPYLTQKVAQAIATSLDETWSDDNVDALVEQLFLTEEAINEESNLQFVGNRVISGPNSSKLLALYRRIYDGKKRVKDDERSAYLDELKLHGLVRADDRGYLTVRNRIYQEVFDRDWIKEHTPKNRWKRVSIVIAVVAVIAVTALFYVLQQAPEPNEVLVQSYVTNFENSANPAIRLNSLANLLALGGYDDQAIELFSSLTNAERMALFSNITPDLVPQMESVIQGSYTTLYVEDLDDVQGSNTELLRTMVSALAQTETVTGLALRNEISIWLQGRAYIVRGDYAAAQTAYSLAIQLEEENPATRFERALTSIAIEDYQIALEDLGFVSGLGPPWQQSMVNVIGNNDRLQNVIRDEESSVLIAFVPTPTVTPVPATSTATLLLPSPTNLPATDAPFPTKTPSSSSQDDTNTTIGVANPFSDPNNPDILAPEYRWEQGYRVESKYDLIINPGGLTIFSGPETRQWQTVWSAPAVTFPVDGNFEAEVKVNFFPFEPFQTASMGIRAAGLNPNRWARIARSFTTPSEFSNVDGQAIAVTGTEDSFSRDFDAISYKEPSVYFKMRREDSNLLFSYSQDGFQWIVITNIEFELPPEAEIFFSVTTTTGHMISATFYDLTFYKF